MDRHDIVGMTLLHYAALNGHGAVVRQVQLMLDRGADLQSGRALEWALDSGPKMNLTFLMSRPIRHRTRIHGVCSLRRMHKR